MFIYAFLFFFTCTVVKPVCHWQRSEFKEEVTILTEEVCWDANGDVF